MLRVLMAAILLLPGVVQAQVKVSECTPRWQSIPAPSMPLVIATPNDSYQLSNHAYKYPFTYGSPAGLYDVSNAVVSKANKVGAWSQPTRVKLKSGWRLYVGGWNQPSTADDAGVVWKVKACKVQPPDPLGAYVTGQEYLFTTAWESDTEANLGIVPYSSVRPEPQLIYTPSTNRMTLGKLTMGGNPAVAPPPIVVASQLPLQTMKLAYSRVTHRGETDLSPPVQFTPPTPPAGWTAADTCEIICNIREPFLQGCLGYYLYAQLDGEYSWRRLPAPHCYGEPSTSDDWLWQLDNNQPKAMRLPVASVGHAAAADPGSYLCNLQVAITDNTGNVIIDVPEVQTYSPVIDEWGTGNDGLPHKFRRKFTAPEGGHWKLTQTQTGINQTGANYWPILLIYNSYSQWIGCECTGNKASAALAFADYQGGKAFGTKCVDCYFGVFGQVQAGITQGMRVKEECSKQWGQHTASELQFTDCTFNGDIAIWLAGIQTADVKFNRTHVACFNRTVYVPILNLALSGDRRISAMLIDTPNQVVMTGGAFMDCPGNAIMALSGADVLIDGIWVDQGYKSLIDVHAGYQARVKLNNGKLNSWTLPGERANLARIFNPVRPSRLGFSDIVLQFNKPLEQDQELDVVHPLYDRLDLRFADTLLSDAAVLREPSLAQTAQEGATIYGYSSDKWPSRPFPGMSLTVPLTVTPGPAEPAAVKVTFNSLTGRQYVKRADWRISP